MKDSLFIMSVFIAAVPISGSATWTPVNHGLPAETLGIRAVVPIRTILRRRMRSPLAGRSTKPRTPQRRGERQAAPE
jgi:hypothetical protein